MAHSDGSGTGVTAAWKLRGAGRPIPELEVTPSASRGELVIPP